MAIPSVIVGVVPKATAFILTAVRQPKFLVLALVAVVALLFSLSMGRTKAIASLLSIYGGYALAILFPFRDRLSSLFPEAYQEYIPAGLFVVLYILAYLAISAAAARTHLSPLGLHFHKVILLGVIQIGLIGSVVISLLPSETARSLSGELFPWLGSAYALWGWATVSLVALPFLSHR